MDFLECHICNVPYDEEDHRPQNPLCRHDICSACVRALINDGIFECPKCREKYKVDTSEDLPVNFGLIDVVRAFKIRSIDLAKETEEKASGATYYICNLHSKAISHWCSKCQMWICTDCIESHANLLGCSTTTSTKAIDILKEKSKKDLEPILTMFEEDVNYVSTKIQEHTGKIKEHKDKSKEHLEMAKEHEDEVQKLQILLDQGNMHREKLEESKHKLTKATSPYTVMDGIKVVTQRKLVLGSWSVKNLRTDTPLGLLKALKEKSFHIELEFKNEKLHSKVSQHEGMIYIHPFQKQSIANGSICLAFDHLQNMIPDEPLMFLELSLGNIVKGHVLVRLDKNLPNIRENMVMLAIGQQGISLNGVDVNQHYGDYFRTNALPFKDIPVTSDINVSCLCKQGDILGRFCSGYLEYLAFYVGAPPKTHIFGGYSVIGCVERGLNVVLECNDKHSNGVNISNCGIVIDQ